MRTKSTCFPTVQRVSSGLKTSCSSVRGLFPFAPRPHSWLPDFLSGLSSTGLHTRDLQNRTLARVFGSPPSNRALSPSLMYPIKKMTQVVGSKQEKNEHIRLLFPVTGFPSSFVDLPDAAEKVVVLLHTIFSLTLLTCMLTEIPAMSCMLNSERN